MKGTLESTPNVLINQIWEIEYQKQDSNGSINDDNNLNNQITNK